MSQALSSRVVRYHRHGAPDVLQVDTLDIPAPGAGEVRIKVEAVGINRVEAMMRTGRAGVGATLPAFIGVECVGVVESVGPGVSGFHPGQAVDLLPGVGKLPFGTYADCIIVSADALVARPAGLSAQQAAALWSAHLTAYAPLVEIAKVGPNDTVLITAASSGVGVAAMGIARLLGARVIAITRSSAKREQLIALGANEVIASDEENLVECVNQLTEGRGARVAFDGVGGPFFETLAGAVAIDGIVIHYGMLGGAPTPLPLAVLFRNLTVCGYALDIGRNPERRQRAVAFVGGHAAAGRLKPTVSAVYPLQDAALAHAALESNAHVGKIVLSTAR